MVRFTTSPRRARTTIALALALLAAPVLAGCLDGEDGKTGYKITSGGAQGVYFPIANGIAAAVNNASVPFFLDVSTSTGSQTNAERISSGEYQFATMQNDVAFYAVQGQTPFTSPITNLKALSSLYPEMIQIVALKESGMSTVKDLEGKKVVLGAAGSGAAVNAQQVLAAAGVNAETQHLDLSSAADQLKDGNVDAVFWTGGIPTAAIVNVATTKPVTVLSIDSATKATLRGQYPFYAEATLPANTYEGVNSGVPTVAIMAVLVASTSVPDDHVQQILDLLFTSSQVQNAHAQAKNIKLDNAFLGLDQVPFHSGAAAYYQSKNMTVPSV